jgi:RHS repeat-associated protein
VNSQVAAFDFKNHPVGVSGGTSYTYDVDGTRVGVTAGSTTTSYLVDASLPYASVVEEYNNGTLAARYDYGDDLVRMDWGSGVYYYLYDGLGSTRQLVSASGAVTDRYGYDAFGIPSHTSGSAVNPFEFNGQQYDSTLGLYFLRARYYAPTEGRFLSQDPLAGSNQDPVTLHRYLYADSDPENIFDPSGKEGIGETAAVLGAAVVIGVALVDLGYQTIVQAGSTSSAWGARSHHYPDITVPLQQVVNRIELKWYALRTDPVMRAKMAKTLTDLDLSNPFASPAANAWDIIGLNSASNSNGWIDQASSPMLDGHSSDLRMVVVDGQTFHSYSANYVAGGTMFRLAGYSQGDLDTWIDNWKMVYGSKDVTAAIAWANAGYDGWDAENTPDSTISSLMPPAPYPASENLTVKWSPYTDEHLYF